MATAPTTTTNKVKYFADKHGVSHEDALKIVQYMTEVQPVEKYTDTAALAADAEYTLVDEVGNVPSDFFIGVAGLILR